MTAMCPNAWARAPDAMRAAEAWNWRDKGALGLLYPSGLPAWLVDALNFLDGCIGEIDADNIGLRKVAAEARNAEFEAKHAR